jgi:hypothetical protein
MGQRLQKPGHRAQIDEVMGSTNETGPGQTRPRRTRFDDKTLKIS